MQKRGLPKIEVSFWGVRGSIPAFSPKIRQVGGNTPCVSIRYGQERIICDGGTGLRPLGEDLVSKRGESLTILLTHLHWDHIFGLPFFLPFYDRRRRIVVGGPAPLRQNLFKIIHPPFFPLTPKIWRARVRWKSLKVGRFKIGSVSVSVRKVRHTPWALGFQFIFPGGTRLVYVSDHELSLKDRSFARWIRGADWLIHDAAYTRRQLRKKKGWGHTAFEDLVALAMREEVQELILYHHNPDATDQELEKRLTQARRQIGRFKSPLRCRLAKEGMKVTL